MEKDNSRPNRRLTKGTKLPRERQIEKKITKIEIEDCLLNLARSRSPRQLNTFIVRTHPTILRRRRVVCEAPGPSDGRMAHFRQTQAGVRLPRPRSGLVLGHGARTRDIVARKGLPPFRGRQQVLKGSHERLETIQGAEFQRRRLGDVFRQIQLVRGISDETRIFRTERFYLFPPWFI